LIPKEMLMSVPQSPPEDESENCAGEQLLAQCFPWLPSDSTPVSPFSMRREQ